MATAPMWGHALQIWDTGRTIRVPKFVFPKLKAIGCLMNGRAILLPTILIFFEDRKYDPIMHELLMVLGKDLTGPAWCKCGCEECKRNKGRIDNTPIPGQNAAQTTYGNVDQMIRDMKGKRKWA